MKRVDLLQSSMETGHSQWLMARLRLSVTVNCNDLVGPNKSGKGLILHPSRNSQTWQDKAVVNVLPCPAAFVSQPLNYTRRAGTSLIMQFKSPQPKGRGHLWSLMKNADRFLCNVLRRMGVREAQPTHLLSVHWYRSCTNEFSRMLLW